MIGILASRRRVVLLALGLLLALDVGRSIFARLGYARPTIRAGVSPHGRALHWQGMIWDHASNWDEEDIQALVVYLRSLPLVRHAIRAPLRLGGEVP